MCQAQVHCCAVASFVQQPPPAWQDTPCNPRAREPAAWQAGASFLDEQAGPSVLCCGHMLHTSCLNTHRSAVLPGTTPHKLCMTSFKRKVASPLSAHLVTAHSDCMTPKEKKAQLNPGLHGMYEKYGGYDRLPCLV